MLHVAVVDDVNFVVTELAFVSFVLIVLVVFAIAVVVVHVFMFLLLLLIILILFLLDLLPMIVFAVPIITFFLYLIYLTVSIIERMFFSCYNSSCLKVFLLIIFLGNVATVGFVALWQMPSFMISVVSLLILLLLLFTLRTKQLTLFMLSLYPGLLLSSF